MHVLNLITCLYIDDSVGFISTQSYTHMKRWWQPKKRKEIKERRKVLL